MEEKYSYNDLQGLKMDIQSVIDISKERKYSRNLMYGLIKNMDVIEKEQKIIKEQLADNAEGFDKFHEERFQLLIDCGAEYKTTPSGSMQITGTSKLDTKKFEEEIKKLEEKYKETLEEQDKIDKENSDILKDELATPNFYMLSIDYFPEEVDAQDMPIGFIKIIKP